MKCLIILLIASFFWLNVSWAVEEVLSDSLVKEAIEKGEKFRQDARAQGKSITEEAEQFQKLYTAEAGESICMIFTPYSAIVEYVRANGVANENDIRDFAQRYFAQFGLLVCGDDFHDLKRFGSVVRYQKSVARYQQSDTMVWQINAPIKTDCNDFPEKLKRNDGTTIYRQKCLHDYYLHWLPLNSKIWFTVLFANRKELTFEFDLSKIK
jgi:hypothetical protein